MLPTTRSGKTLGIVPEDDRRFCLSHHLLDHGPLMADNLGTEPAPHSALFFIRSQAPNARCLPASPFESAWSWQLGHVGTSASS